MDIRLLQSGAGHYGQIHETLVRTAIDDAAVEGEEAPVPGSESSR